MALSRIEEILENMLGESDPLPAPLSRNEALLIQLLNKLQSQDELKATENNGTVTLELR